MIPRLIPWLVRGIRSVSAGLTVLLLVAGGGTSPAQVVLDGKFGSGAVPGPNYNITADLGRTVDKNLFHSFTQFDLRAGDVARFSGPANIQNILSRVTGGNPSSINGTIRSDIAGANFFFINPSGVMFGPNAVVNVSGSFAASTANYLKLADGARFVASLGADDSGLSTAPVSAFGFLGNSPGSVSVQQSTLSVPSLKTIALVGGDIALDHGSLRSPGGQINIVSVQSAGEVPVDPRAPSIAEFSTAFPQQGQINLRNSAQLDASSSGGGRIVIRGGTLVVDNSKIQANTTDTIAGQGIDIAVLNDLNLINGGQINSLSTVGRGAGGNINLSAQSIRLNGGGLVDQSFNPTTQISTASGNGGTAKGGDIVIQAGSLELVNSAQISSATSGGGNAGRIDITASSVRLDGLLTTPTQITANTSKSTGGGSAGDIVIRTGTLDIINGATLLAASFGSGRAGIIDINAQSVNLLSGAVITAPAFGAGSGGNIRIMCESMRIDGQDTLTGGPDFLTAIQAVTTSLSSPAPGGSVQITAGSLDLVHMGSIFTTSYGRGRGGNIEIAAGNLSLANSSTIRAESLATGPAGLIDINAQSVNLVSGAIITASTSGSGNGGDIQITAESISINGQDTLTGGPDILTGIQAVTTSSRSPAPGGNIQITAGTLELDHMGSVSTTSSGLGAGGIIEVSAGNLTLANSSSIRAAGEASGRAGNISLRADKDIVITGNSAVSTSAPRSSGGDITVNAGSEIWIEDSQITAEAGLNGGNISLAAPKLTYLLNSTITSKADTTGSGFGNGGNLTIDPSFLILNNSALISKSSFGNGGNISIQTDYFFLSTSTIDASAPFGLPGTVSVSAPEVDLSGSLVGLPENLLSAESQLRPDCAIRLSGNISSFIVLGRGGLPIEPGGFIPSSAVKGDDDAR